MDNLNKIKRLTIFVHYNEYDNIDKYIFYNLYKLRKISNFLVFISNSNIEISDNLRNVCDEIIIRKNEGYDFRAWSEYILSKKLEDYGEVILTNSSIIGPFFDLEPIMNRMASDSCDFWGMTYHKNPYLHLQSYFLVFKKPILRSRQWIEFWSSVESKGSKEDVINAYEIPLTRYFVNAGFSSNSLTSEITFNYFNQFAWKRRKGFLPRWKRLRKTNENLTHYAAYDLVKAGMPYLKKHLLIGPQNQRFPKEVKKIKKLTSNIFPWSCLNL